MSIGEALEDAFKMAGPAMGQFAIALTRRRVNKRLLLWIAHRLDTAVAIIMAVAEDLPEKPHDQEPNPD